MSPVTVQRLIDALFESLALEVVVVGSAADRALRAMKVQKPGLAFTGFSSFVHQDRVQVLGQSELVYLDRLSSEERVRAIAYLVECKVACILVTKGWAIPAELISACVDTATPLLRTQARSSEAIKKLLTYLEDSLTPRTSIHAVLVDVDGVGVLLTGASGVGKSECALELVLRGHRLVADDVVEIRRQGEGLVGQAADLIKNLIEIRGLGILNVAELYGVAATRDVKRIELHVELEEWRPSRPYDRTGLAERRYDVLQVALPSLLVPVRPGRDIAAIVEVAARDFLLRLRGHHAAQELKSRMDTELAQARSKVHALLETSDESGDLPQPASLRQAARISTDVHDHVGDEVE